MGENGRIELSLSHLKKFKSSRIVRHPEMLSLLLGQLSGAHNIEINQSHYTLLRDFLLVEISIDNANRAGVLSNMTVKEIQ